MRSLQYLSGCIAVLVMGLTVHPIGAAQEVGTVMESAPVSPNTTVSSTILKSSDIKWGPGPEGLPAGAEMAVIQGDPSKSGPVVIRLKLPANYKVPAHWRTQDENITVLSGIFNLGMGDTLDPTQGSTLDAGGFVAMPGKMHHFAWTDNETIVQVHMMGPWDIFYVDPANDPRKKSQNQY